MAQPCNPPLLPESRGSCEGSVVRLTHAATEPDPGPAISECDPVMWLQTSGSPAELRKQCLRVQDYLWHAQKSGGLSVSRLESIHQQAWRSLRSVAADQQYPPEPEPPQNCAQGIRLLDQLIHWCTNKTSSLADGDCNHYQETSQEPSCSTATQQTSKKSLSDLLSVKQRIDPTSRYIGTSRLILEIFKTISIFNASPDKSVLILGPTGAGKTEIAELIHTVLVQPDLE